MKATKQCPKCQSIRIGFLSEQPDSDGEIAGDGEKFVKQTDVATRSVGFAAETGFWQVNVIRNLIGHLVAYVCTDCGYHESYVDRPQAVPWEKLRGFAWVNPPQVDEPGPYR